jgi:acyl-CoA thioesterase
MTVQVVATSIDRTWFSWVGAHGGLVASHLARAAADGAPDGLALRSLTTHFLRPVDERLLELAATPVSASGTIAVTQVTAVQDGRDVAVATALLGAAREPGLAWAPEPAPSVPRPADCPVVTLPPELVPFGQHLEYRGADGSRPLAGGTTPRLRAWVRFVDGRRPDAADLVTLADALAPGLYGIATTPAPVPSVDLSVHLTGHAAAGEWVLLEQRTLWSLQGWAVDEAEAWDERGVRLAQARQTRRVLPMRRAGTGGAAAPAH